MAQVLATPGVYIDEKSAFPSSAVAVATAVPAFVGYTEKALKGNKSIANIPTKITSLNEYHQFFGKAPKITFEVAKDENETFKLEVNRDSNYNLYRNLRLFFANGGSTCYIVSVGNYKTKIKEGDLIGDEAEVGIRTLLKEPEPTMLVIPDAVLLDKANCDVLQKAMLKHCGADMKNRVAILDVHNGDQPAEDVITPFREGVGTEFLQWGAAYYPWLQTTIVSADDVRFTHITNPDVLSDLLKAEIDDMVQNEGLNEKRSTTILEEIDKIKILADLDKAEDAVKNEKHKKKEAENRIIELGKVKGDEAIAEAKPEIEEAQKIVDGADKAIEDAEKVVEEAKAEAVKLKTDEVTLHQTLNAVSPLYKAIMGEMTRQLNVVPPSGAMAGIISMVDNEVGVFQSPANVSVGSVIKPSVNITHSDQEDLNLPLNGKAVNAIRSFPGKGVLVWGARTLDGNSMDWRYLSVRRTVIMIEQSLKIASEPYVFKPNVVNTWVTVKGMMTNFLTDQWKKGALAGSTPEDAFSVDVGLGVTMTSTDILNGIMNITVKLAVVRPAEFIVITFQQQMQKS